MDEESELEARLVEEIASLVQIGGKSGDAVVGLSAVRRARRLAFIFASTDLARNTWVELQRCRSQGTQVYQTAHLAYLTAGLGRSDASVIAIKPGALARGIADRMAESSTDR